MVTIDWGSLDDENQKAYIELEKKFNILIEKYKSKDGDRFKIIENMIAKRKKDWDLKICFETKQGKKEVDPTAMLLYEYCLAGEKVSHRKVSFSQMAKRLFEEQDVIRIGNPIRGKDDEFLYGKGLDDQTAMPITSRKYRIVTHAGAQHIDYYKEDRYRQALFLYEKGKRTYYEAQMDADGKIIRDKNGEVVKREIVEETDGIDFHHISKGQSLLTNLRQTLFHELDHTLQKDYINPEDEETIAYEYVGPDGVKYRNYETYDSYQTLDPNTSTSAIEKEPDYYVKRDKDGKIIVDNNDNPIYFYQDKNGNEKQVSEYSFPMTNPKKLEKPLCVSHGLTTLEVTPEGKTIIINMVEEGFVEDMARAMVEAIDPHVEDLDYGRYPKNTKIANRVVNSRDKSLGVDGPGSTYAVLLTHSSTFKQELESIVVSKYKSDNRKKYRWITPYSKYWSKKR